MHVAVRKVRISSKPEHSYFLRVEWTGRDLGSGFLLLLTDGQDAWRGEVSEDDVCSEAGELEMQREKYVQDLQQALTGSGPSNTEYSFTLMPPQPGPGSNVTLAYEKVQKDISFRLSSVLLCAVPEPVEEVKALLSHGLERGTTLENRNQRLQEENQRLREEQQHITEQLERYACGKEALEEELYSRFVLVLNEKKAKIRSLQESITHLQQETRGTAGESSSQGGGMAAGESRASDEGEDAYGASTDEEQEEEQEEEQAGPAPKATAPTQGTGRRSPLDDSLSDITDVAPCRKRRFRHLRPPDPVSKKPTPETSQRRRRGDSPVVVSAAANKEQATQRSTDVIATSPDAEDLFEDF